jgi:antitoxin ParD1/3/4
METMNIFLTEPLKQFVDTQVAERGYNTASEYVRALIRADQKRKVQEKLEALLREGLESRDTKELTTENWANIRRTVRERLAQRNAAIPGHTTRESPSEQAVC